MKAEVSEPRNEYIRPLIEADAYYVMISHQELDSLIAPLMHLAELDSDKEHRDALKQELKTISRNWLDEQYSRAGYTNYQVLPGAWMVNINAVKHDKGAAYRTYDPNQAGHNPAEIGISTKQ